MLRKFYILMPKTYLELYLFKLYLIILGRIFFNSNYNVKLIVENNNSKFSEEISSIFQDLIETLNFPMDIEFVEKESYNITQNQNLAFKTFKNIETIKDCKLSYLYKDFAAFYINIIKSHNDLVKVLDRYDLINKKFNSIFTALKQIHFKTNNIIMINLYKNNNPNSVKLPINYYVNCIAFILKFNKFPKHKISTIRFIICYNEEISELDINYFIQEVSNSLIHVSALNFMDVSKICAFFPELSKEEIIFNLNKISYSTICSTESKDLFPCLLKQHNTLESDLVALTLYSKYLFLNTMIARSVGI